MSYQVTLTSPIPPPPQMFSNIATLITSTEPNVTGVSLFRNGLFLTEGEDADPGVDYHRNVGRIIFFAGAQPVAGDILVADVFTLQTTIDGTAPAYGTEQVKVRQAAPLQFSNVIASITVTGTMDGVNREFRLAFGSSIQGTLDGVNAVFTTGVVMKRARVYRNGQLMTLNSDCSVSGQSVVFLGEQIPQPGDLILILGWL